MANRQWAVVKNSKKKRLNFFDYSLLFVIIFFICFGLVMLYSTSSYNAQVKFGSSTYFLKKQAFASFLGMVVMGGVIWFGYRRLKNFSKLIYFASIISIFLVLTPLGVSANGAKRWISVGFGTIQPAEFAKLGVILFLAFVISKNVDALSHWKNLIKMFLWICPPILAVVLITKNLSSALIIAMIAFVMLFVASPNWKHFVAPGIAGLVFVIAILEFGAAFRSSRIEVWHDPAKYSAEGGYQVLQGLYAIGSGGLFGKGLGQSVQKLGFVPEAQNDYIFTIICEELGLFGAISVIFMFLFMIWRFFVIANNATDLYGSLIVVGVMTHIAVQVILNIAVVSNTIPNTGITLPFISYGGTSIVFLLIEMGLVLSVSREIKIR